MPFSAWTLLFSCGRAALERRLGHIPRRECRACCRVALILQLVAAKEGTMLYTILVILIILIILGFVFGRGRF